VPARAARERKRHVVSQRRPELRIVEHTFGDQILPELGHHAGDDVRMATELNGATYHPRVGRIASLP
jgi:hypothetical protein